MTAISIQTKKIESANTDLLAVLCFEGATKVDRQLRDLNQALGGALASVLSSGDFKGKTGESLLVYTHKKILTPRIAFIGLGKKTDYSPETLRLAGAALAVNGKKTNAKILALLMPLVLPPRTSIDQAVGALVEGITLASYRFLHYKKHSEKETANETSELQVFINRASDRTAAGRGTTRGLIIANAVNYTRDLANHPGNVMTPAMLADEATKLAKSHKLKVKVLEKSDMKKLGMGALLAVNQGSSLPPKFIVLEYSGRKSGQPTVLVGKGITFDSGGISLKPGKNMEEMKFDMCGAATVLGTLKAAAELRLPLKLVGLIPATENLPSGAAVKPGDVVSAMSGKTIEVINTDAEGRMILSDALSYAARYKPKLVMDFATLTGSVIHALGPDYTGAFASDDVLMAKLRAAAKKTGELVWPLPLAPEYKEMIKSEIADIKNTGDGSGAGATMGALFLQEFVSYPWIHLDIAGTAWTTKPKPYKPLGATGYGVRLTLEFLTR